MASRRKKDVTRALRGRMSRIVRATRAARPHCCIAWSMGCTDEGRLMVHFTCLVHDAGWYHPVEEVPYGDAQSNPCSPVGSPCPPRRAVHRPPSQEGLAAASAQAASVAELPSTSDTLPLFSSLEKGHGCSHATTPLSPANDPEVDVRNSGSNDPHSDGQPGR